MSSSTSSQSRDGSRDRAESQVLKHQHSFSDSGRASVPMWDSSDPDRAPPPLPLNPGTPGSPITRPNVSARIEEAAAVINARARENAPSSYITNAPPAGSPEKSLIKPQHKRMQSMQSISVRGLSDSLERRSPDKGLRTSKLSEYEEYRASRSPERSPTRSGSDTPTPSGRATPSHLNRPILGENTPPSATMLALQSIRNRQESEAPLANITNVPTSSTSRLPLPQTYDAISSQILSLTSIATNLQREMAQLSRRSKDNATDLYTLKEATNSRDEDIRKSLKDLVSGLDNRFSNIDTKLLTTPEATRSTTNLGLFLDNKAHNGTPSRKAINLPRMPSPTSFSAAFDRDLTASPSLVSSDGAASIALLDKVLREMATKDGQEKIFATLENVKFQTESKSQPAGQQNSSPFDPAAMRKLEEILTLMKDLKETSADQALVKAAGGSNGTVPSQIDLYNDDQPKSGSLAKTDRQMDSRASQNTQRSEFVNEEIMKMLKNVKLSLSQGGGLTNEVKALVRELRGEVLGMGREIARKLEQAESTKKDLRPDAQGPGRDEIAQIVEAGLAELKEHMHHLVRESRRQSSGSTRSVVDTQEIILAVRSALAEMPRQQEAQIRDPVAEREELLVSIKEAWEDCKPEIALEHFGLERDEILDTLKEGLKSYHPQEQSPRDVGVTYEEVVDAVQKGLANFKPPPIETEAGATREEILITVRECLESFEFPMPLPAPFSDSGLGSGVSRVEILETIREGLSKQAPLTKEVEFNREDLFDAIRACLEGESNPLGGMGERVLDSMHDFLGTMKTEFQQYSAANGKDTEQVLDAMKDGLEELRADIENYVDRAADVTGKDEIIDVVKAGFEAMQADLDKGFASRPNQRDNLNTPDLLDAMEKEFEHLRDSISKSLARADASEDKEDILDAIRDIADDRRSSLSSNSEDIVRTVKEELQHMRTALAGTLVRSGSSIEREEVLEAIREGLDVNCNPRKSGGNESILSNTSELLDAFQEGVDGLRSDMQKLMDRPVDLSTSYEILDTLKAGLESVRSDIERLHEKQNDFSDTATARGHEVIIHDENLISTEIEGLKVMITQLRIKVEALDTMQPPPQMQTEARIHKDDLDDIHAAIKEVHHSVNNVRSMQEVPLSSNAASKNDIDAIETLLRSMQEVPLSSNAASKNDIDAIETLLRSMQEVPLSSNAASKEDTDAIETLLRNVKAKLEDFTFPDADLIARTSHLDSVEDMLRNIKSIVEDSASQANDRSVPKEDFNMVELLMKEVAAGVEEIQTKVRELTPEEGSVTKADIQAIETLCLDTKVQIEELALPNPETLPTRDDVEGIKDTIKAFQEQIEAENELTAQAFEARKIEHGGLATKIDDVKAVMGEIRDELMSKLDGSEEGIVELNKVLGMHHDSMSTYATAASMAELTDLVNKEFERHMDHHTATRQFSEERDVTMFSKHDEVSADLKSKIEDKFNELMTKYDDAQTSNDAKLSSIGDRDQMHLETMNGTKAVVDDLKLLIDALGSTVTETCDRMSDDSKTLFTGIDNVNTKMGELHSTNAHEHGLTRDEVVKTLTTALRVEGSLHAHQPAIMTALREILGLVGQHYEHSQQQTESFSRATEEIKTGVNAIPSSIQPLLPAPPEPPATPPLVREIPVQKEYDDSQVHDKLNNLISHAVVAKDAFAKMDSHHQNTQESLASLQRLENIHEQVMVTAGEVSSMVATQTRLMAEHHESKAAETAEAAIALEKRTAQKERVEADILALNDQKEAIVKSMAALRREQEELSRETKKLSREVAKLETALSIRQEEMKDMDARAENLERRILEGVMNHARSVNIAKAPKKGRITPQERDRAMSLKRVPSTSSNSTTKTSIKDPGSTIGNAVGMTLKKRAPLSSAASSVSSRTSGIDRRILSTSNVTGNRGRDTPSRALMLAPTASTGLVSLKRSHSVKSNPSSYFGGRKASWSGTVPIAADKENHVFDEEQDEDGSVGDDTSDAGTERRTSYGTSVMYTDSNLTYSTESSLSRNGNRTASYASSVGGALGGKTESIAEEAEEEDAVPQHDEGVHEAEQEDESAQIMQLLETSVTAVEAGQNNSMAMTTFEGLETPMEAGDGWSDLQPPRPITGDEIKFHQPSDSGLGTEPPTADCEHVGEAQEYFDMSRREAGVDSSIGG